ncbi:hypothetical protein Goari_000647, partial [Gossypium aridum]|nr:hypothetical protein [Gossypium aridum]
TFSNTVEEKAKWVFNKLKVKESGRYLFVVFKCFAMPTISGPYLASLKEIPSMSPSLPFSYCKGKKKGFAVENHHVLKISVPNPFMNTDMRNMNKSRVFFPTGKPTKSLPDLLREYNLPPGLFPQNVICYEFDETKAKLIVYMSSPCEVSFKDSSVIRYATRVKGILLRGKLTGIEGMKTKVLVWVKVTSVAVEGYKSDKVWFTAGVKKSRPKDAYETPRDAVRVEEF